MVERWLSFAATVEGTTLATWLRSSAWGYPAMESLHLLGLALLIGSAVAFDVRLLGVASPLPVHLVARFLLPIARIGFGMAVVSGAVLFIMQARTFAVMPIFFLKMGTIAIAVTNTLIFHQGIFASVGEWTHAVRAPRQARVAAVVSLMCWTLALVCGRFLAYV
jgi:hypothetical protein